MNNFARFPVIAAVAMGDAAPLAQSAQGLRTAARPGVRANADTFHN
jgi:hypothetical protein